jgi:MoaA/NifB/PqqE/SkfB family radical SAM enzyme
LINGFPAKIIRFLLLVTVLYRSVGIYHSVQRGLLALNKLRRKRQVLFGGQKISKFIRSRFRYYMALNTPAWPSKVFNILIGEELNRVEPYKHEKMYLRTLIFGITTKCPLHCRHCYASDVLDRQEELSINDLQTVLWKFKKRGLAQVQWSGGEPLHRFEDLLSLTHQASHGTECWVLTSGMELTSDKAIALKKAGMTGVNVSLDHWDAEKHNAFRERDDSFSWALQAVQNARNHGLLVAVTLCATAEFVSSQNLWSYIHLAHGMKVNFVQILEARSIGRFAEKDVRMSTEQLNTLDDFFYSMNYDRKCRNMPIVIYHGYRQRRFGCRGGGDEFLYVDPLGEIHPCPFSNIILGNALTDDITEILKKIDCNQTCDRYHLARNHQVVGIDQSIGR